MNSKVIAGSIVALLILVGTGVFFISADNSSETVSQSTTPTAAQNSTTTKDSSTTSQSEQTTSNVSGNSALTAADVAEHSSESDCWTIIEGAVYDITSYIPRHPGGDNILSACGVDGTDFFNGKKAGQSGEKNNHGGSAESQLKSLKVGDLE